MTTHYSVALLFSLGVSTAAYCASHEQIISLYHLLPVGSVVKCEAIMKVKSRNTTIPVHMVSRITITGRQFNHLYFDGEATYSILNVGKPYLYVSYSAIQKIEGKQRRIRLELDRKNIHVDFPGNPEMERKTHEAYYNQPVSYVAYSDITINEPPGYTVRQYSYEVAAGVIIQTCSPENV
ncbi:hypothetical protein [Citrobacter rodentium]|uniref:Exported protein n=2 Tax=Citrobacter rodentium TaxID=67825 RepID=D2TLB7_CITRI|nr:hypothetical protein [Citrobacter rodentium]QBY29503.1 hypothetical protein E2R62_11925 [Citrobacter rodentium]UHO33101.1 hypothetical protein K7R23_11080 [Citrobacter rodentium NBRC 105723 = DSM 16636]CBG89802.1 putative exported protein [Citrobacter rodentium ICC168]HAT8012543.1 hypothetical protein [Citrobacter rodentium NBRC 105723 = DSM 16636]HAT8017843.1 hypothetical protein [Citrobacter rodentium]